MTFPDHLALDSFLSGQTQYYVKKKTILPSSWQDICYGWRNDQNGYNNCTFEDHVERETSRYSTQLDGTKWIEIQEKLLLKPLGCC